MSVTPGATAESPPQPRHRDFAGYLGGSALWMAGVNLQQFLVTWMLVGMLAESGTRVGLAQFLIALPGFALMLFGGSVGDRRDGRSLLIGLHLLAFAPPLLMAVGVATVGLSYLTVILFGISVAAVAGFSEPPRSALLNRVTHGHIQRTVVLTTTVSATIGLAGTWLGGRVDAFGLQWILIGQALLFGSGALAVAVIAPGLTRMPVNTRPSRPLSELADGFRVLWRTPKVRDVIGLNFLSSIFNAGAWFVVYPFLVTRAYAGDAALLAILVIVFFAGSIASNIGLLRFVPMARPGRLFLVMQITRVVIFAILWSEPPLWLMIIATIAWGMNMGITSTTARMMVQSGAPEAHRSRVLSIFILGTLSAAPLGAILLGTLVDVAGVRAGFIPGLLVSMVIFAVGAKATRLWTDREGTT
ncbi:MAG: MFS transporter [Gammaproteobacteria bacterium]|nr:MFS transporter [Gammaproteobacteria bacterium]